MGYNSNDVSTGKPDLTGAIFRAPLDSTLPTDPTEALNAAFVSMGYVGTDGVSQTFDSGSEDLNVWGPIAVGTAKSSFSDKFTIPFASTADKDVKAVLWGDGNVSHADGVITAFHNGDDQKYYAWVIKRVLNDGRKEWMVYPKAKVSEIGDISYKDTDITVYPITFSAAPYLGSKTGYEITEEEAAPTQG